MIPNTFIQDLLSRLDVVEVVGKYVQLKKSGTNFSGLCPFHNEKTPSFMVSPEKQFYHCFGCGAHGTAINFLMEHTGFSFPEAVEELAHSVGLVVPHEKNQINTQEAQVQKQRKLTLLEVMQKASQAYCQQLRLHSKAVEYLKKRGLTGQVAAQFKLGYAPVNAHFLDQMFADQVQQLVEAGLVIKKEAKEMNEVSRRYDRFRDRVMFPIRNVKGEVIAFGGRIIDQGEPKYLNSPETPLFSKSHELYGLFEARLAIREQRFVLVVEGYMDVVALAQYGFANTVATLGTACTSFHIQKLIRYADKIVFSFDGDSAGKRAARRALEACLPRLTDQHEMRFLFLPTNHDPDSFIREFGVDAFAEAIEQAMPLSLFLINEILFEKEISTPEGRAKALFEAKPLIQAIPESILRSQIVQMLAQRLQMAIDEVLQALQISGRRAMSNRSFDRRRAYQTRREVTATHHHILRNLIMYPHLALSLTSECLDILYYQTKEGEVFRELLQLIQSLGPSVNFQQLSVILKEAEHAPIFEQIMKDIMKYDENVRDLLVLQQNIDSTYLTKQASLAEKELLQAILKIEYDAYNARLATLSKQKSLSEAELIEFSELQKKRADIKPNLGAYRE